MRYLCPEGTIQDTRGIVCGVFCDTPFRDRDNPSGRCDCEIVNYGKKSCPGGSDPVGIRCNDVLTGKDYAQFGQNITCKPEVNTSQITLNHHTDLHVKLKQYALSISCTHNV